MINRASDSHSTYMIAIPAASIGPLRPNQGCSGPIEVLNDFLSEHLKSNAAVEQTKITLVSGSATSCTCVYCRSSCKDTAGPEQDAVYLAGTFHPACW